MTTVCDIVEFQGRDMGICSVVEWGPYLNVVLGGKGPDVHILCSPDGRGKCHDEGKRIWVGGGQLKPSTLKARCDIHVNKFYNELDDKTEILVSYPPRIIN